jgi:hypothetical protein
VARAGRRREVVQPFDLRGAQLDAVGGGVLLDARNPLGARNRRDVVALREQPGQRDLGRSDSYLSGNGSNLVDDAQIALEVLAGEARVRLAPVVVGELLGRADLAGEEAVAERRVRNESIPNSRSKGSSSASGSRVHREYSVCSAATGCTAWARRIVVEPASDSPMWRTLPSATSLARAPTVSSMGVFGSTRCW